MKIQRYVRPKDLDEAYSLMRDEKGFPIAGGAWSRMNTRTVDCAVDLSSLDLRYISKKSGHIEIGAMTTARDIETSSKLHEAFGSMPADAVSHIVGVQLRNIVTVGGTVSGKYGFSDLLTTLLALGAQVGIYGDKKMPLEDFLADKSKEPKLVEKVIIDSENTQGAYTSVRKTHTDFAVLNVAAVRRDGSWRIAVGARPGATQLSEKAAEVIGSEEKPDSKKAAKAGEAAASELTFGGDIRGSSEYRKQICSVLVRRAIEEATQ